MNRISYILICIVCLYTTIGISQSIWNLDECIEHALANNLTIKNLNYSELSGKETYRQSIRELLPTISGNSNYNIQYGRSIDPNNNAIIQTDFFSNNYSIDASITIFQGFQRLNTIKANRFISKALHQETLQEKYLLAFRIMQAYYDVLFFQELVTISQSQEDISLSNYKLVKRQIELGIKAGADLYEAESVLVSDRLIVTQSINSLKTAKLLLLQEMNLQNQTDITIQPILDKEEEIISKDVDATTIYKNALTFIPTILSSEYREKSASKNVAISRGNLYPTLSLSGGYGTGYFETNIDASGEVIPFKTQIKDNASQFIGASLNIPIFSRWRNRSEIKQQKIALQRASNDLNIRKQELNNVIQQLAQEYVASIATYEQTKQRTLSRKLSFEIAQKRYDKGLINALDLFTTKNLYATAQNENIQAKLKLKLQEKTLDFYKGLPVFNIDNIH